MTDDAPPPPPVILPPTPQEQKKFLTPVHVSYNDTEVEQAVPHTSYGAIALDVALGVIPEDQIARTWNMPVEMLRALIDTPPFRVELDRARRALTAKGDMDGFAARSKAIVEKALPGMFALLTSPDTRPEDRLRMFEKFVRFAKLDPDANKKDGPSMVVQFNLSPDIRGMNEIKVSSDGGGDE